MEDAFKKGMIDTLSKLCNESNAATEIGSLQEFKDYCKKNKHTACFNCISINCFSRQRASNAAKIKRVFNTKCSKKQLTLGEVKALAQKSDTPKNDEGTSIGATATVTSPISEHDEEINAIFDSFDDKETEVGFSNNMADVQVNHNITTEKL